MQKHYNHKESGIWTIKTNSNAPSAHPINAATTIVVFSSGIKQMFCFNFTMREPTYIMCLLNSTVCPYLTCTAVPAMFLFFIACCRHGVNWRYQCWQHCNDNDLTAFVCSLRFQEFLHITGVFDLNWGWDKDLLRIHWGCIEDDDVFILLSPRVI